MTGFKFQWTEKVMLGFLGKESVYIDVAEANKFLGDSSQVGETVPRDRNSKSFPRLSHLMWLA